MKKLILISLLLAAGLIACHGNKAPEEAAPPPPEIMGGPPPNITGLNFSQRLEMANASCEEGSFEGCELSCQLLQNSALPQDQVPNLACRCFFTEFARWLESEPVKQVQQRLCNGFTTVERLFGQNGLFPTALAARESGGAEPNVEEYFPCLDISDPSSKEGVLKILINLKANRSDFDQLKPFANESVNGLKAILPTLERAMATNAQCSIPGRLVGNTEEDFIFKSGDLFHWAGKFKLYGATAQALSSYEFNLKPDKILAEDLSVQNFEGTIRNIGTQFIHQFLVADAGKNNSRATEARTHEGETIRSPDRPLVRRFDEKPLGVFPRRANLLNLKNDFLGAFNNFIEVNQRERESTPSISQDKLENYQKIKTSLEGNQEVRIANRLFVNFHRLLEFPPSISNVSQRDFENNPLISDPRSILINFLKIEQETRTWGERVLCRNPVTGVTTVIDRARNCDDAADECIPPNRCAVGLITTEAQLAVPNKEVILAAVKESAHNNFEPEFGRHPGRICQGDEILIRVSDRERDPITLALPRGEALPAEMDVTIATNGFRIVTRETTPAEMYTFFVGASDGHGSPLLNSNPEGGAAAFNEPLPEVIHKVRVAVGAVGTCDRE